MTRENMIVKKSKRFAIHIMQLVQELTNQKCPFFIIQQVGRSGTSIGANIIEAEHAISKRDFLLKMYISYKECNETLYWLDLLAEAGYVSKEQYDMMKEECMEIERILASITKTTRKNLQP